MDSVAGTSSPKRSGVSESGALHQKIIKLRINIIIHAAVRRVSFFIFINSPHSSFYKMTNSSLSLNFFARYPPGILSDDVCSKNSANAMNVQS
jgi:hypothetical protein